MIKLNTYSHLDICPSQGHGAGAVGLTRDIRAISRVLYGHRAASM